MSGLLRSLAAILFVAAAAAPGCHTVVETPSAPPGPVSGTVLHLPGVPAAGAQVRVGDILTMTDADGHFSVARADGSYDVAVVTYPGTAYVYLGLSNHTPTFLLGDDDSGNHQGSVVALLPAADTATVGSTVVVEVIDTVTWASQAYAKTAPGPDREIDVSWVGPPSIMARVHAFQYQIDPTTSAPTQYIGYDTTDLSLSDVGGAPWTVSWQPPPFSTATVSLSATLPEGYKLFQSALSMRQAGPDYTFPVGWSMAPGPAVSFPVPALPGALFAASVDAFGPTGASVRAVPGLAAGTTGLPVAVDSPPALFAPANGDTVGVGSPVSWDSGGEGATFTTLRAHDPTMGPLVYLVGGDGSTTVPDLSALGVTFPHGVAYDVTVFRNGATATVDDLAANGRLFAPPDQPSTYAYSYGASVTIK
jgi:hypothetical protein